MKTLAIKQKRIFEAMKVEDESKGRLFRRLQATGAAPICKRCGGSGKYAYNLMDGTTCYGCGGAGVIIDNEPKLLEIVESAEIQERLNTYLAELEAKKQPTQKPVKQIEESEPQTKEDMITEMFNSAIERLDWEFVVRLIVIQKNKGSNLVEANKSATEKQINYIKMLTNKKAAKQQSDKENLIKLLEEVKNGSQSLNHAEVQYIINWLTEK